MDVNTYHRWFNDWTIVYCVRSELAIIAHACRGRNVRSKVALSSKTEKRDGKVGREESYREDILAEGAPPSGFVTAIPRAR